MDEEDTRQKSAINGSSTADGEVDGIDIADYVPIPPDGGWGWVIVFASFMANIVVDGILYSFGIYLTELKDEFHSTHAMTGLVGSLPVGFYMLIGPIAGGMLNMFGARPVMITGAIISTFAFLTSSFAGSITVMMVTYGVIGVYGWRGTLLIQAGMVLNCVVFGALLRPLKTRRNLKKLHNKLLEREASLKQTLVAMKSENNFSENVLGEFKTSATDDSADPVDVAVVPQKYIKRDSETDRASPRRRSGLVDRLSRSVSLRITNRRPARPIFKERRRATVAAEPKDQRQGPASVTGNRRRISAFDLAEPLRLLSGGADQSAVVSAQAVFNLAGVDLKDLSRPMYHRDALYSGPTVRPRSVDSSVRQRYSIDEQKRARISRQISIPQTVIYDETLDEILDGSRDRRKRVCIPASVRNVVTEMIDVRLLIVPEMVLLIIANIFSSLGFLTPYVYLTARAEQVGVPQAQASFLVSIIGITNTLGRVVFGWMADQPWVTALTINNCALLFCGFITCLVPWCNTYPLLVVYSALFGFVLSSTASLPSIILVELLTLEHLTNAFGLMSLFGGTTSIIGSPISGAVYDLTKSYDASFWFSGLLLALSGVISCMIPIYRWHKLRQQAATAFVEDRTRGAADQCRRFLHEQMELESMTE